MQLTKDVFDFLTDLENNNNREWFAVNKERFQAIRADFECFFDSLIQEIYKFDKSVGTQTAAKCMYRIYRDTRFSNDKTPYKVHIAVFLASGGFKQHTMPGYYLHLQNNASCMGTGLYMPLPKDLEKIRKEIYYNIEEFKSILTSPNYSKYYDGLITEGKLKKAPKNFPPDFQDIELLKNKSFSAMNMFSNETVLSKDFAKYVLQGFKAGYDLNKFLLRAISE